MNTKNCPECGAPLKLSAQECVYCGEEFEDFETDTDSEDLNDTDTQSQNSNHTGYSNANLPEKSRLVAVLLAFFLGVLGVHLFYLNKPLRGIVYLILAFTGITCIFALIDFIVYLAASKEYFYKHYKVRIV